MTYLDKSLEWLGMQPVADEYSFWLGVTVMATVIAILVVLGTVYRIIRLIRRPVREISVKSDAGEMKLALSALKDFVRSSLKDISYIKLNKVAITGSKSSQKLKLTISAPRGKSLPTLTDEITMKIDDGLVKELGIKSVKTGVIRVKRFNDKVSGAANYHYAAAPVFVAENKVEEEQPEPVDENALFVDEKDAKSAE